MIRKFTISDLDCVMDIWLNANIQAHNFIHESYWKKNFNMVKEILPQAEVYVYEKDSEIIGFVGIDSGYIAGIFVREDMRSHGIGKMLLETCKVLYNELSLHVYEKNTGALTFYEREGFTVNEVRVDENTREAENYMTWKK